jgi:hypothetical protein
VNKEESENEQKTKEPSVAQLVHLLVKTLPQFLPMIAGFSSRPMAAHGIVGMTQNIFQ